MKYFAPHNITIYDALKKLASSATKYLIIVNNKKKLLGTLVDGDLRRAIIKNVSLNTTIKDIYQKKPHYLVQGKFEQKKLKNFFIINKISFNF